MVARGPVSDFYSARVNSELPLGHALQRCIRLTVPCSRRVPEICRATTARPLRNADDTQLSPAWKSRSGSLPKPKRPPQQPRQWPESETSPFAMPGEIASASPRPEPITPGTAGRSSHRRALKPNIASYCDNPRLKPIPRASVGKQRLQDAGSRGRKPGGGLSAVVTTRLRLERSNRGVLAFPAFRAGRG